MIRKLGPLWVNLDAFKCAQVWPNGTMTVMLTEGRNIVLEGIEAEAFIDALYRLVTTELTR